MPAIARKGVDKSSPHNSEPDSALLFAEGSSNVFIGGNSVVRIGDKTGCGDAAQTGSSSVLVNGIAAHRIGDSITVHPGGSPSTLTCVTGAPAGAAFAG